MSIQLKRHFTTAHQKPFDQVKWRTTDVAIIGADGEEVFRQNGVEVPEFWSDRAAQIVASKYFRKGETSVKQMIHRVVSTIGAATTSTIFNVAQRAIFEDELTHMLVNQMFSFNSPVWFNVGVSEKPQASACFILGVEDSMESIIDLQKSEVQIFKGGSGAGSNLSKLRSSREKISGGGYASGPVSFAKGYDAWAGITKSGGTNRRAAKMVILNVDHPDILEQRDGTPGFVRAKTHAEQVARDLLATGKYTAEFNVPGNVYDLVGFQNANLSVRVTDKFMQSLFDLSLESRKIWDEIVKAAWECGDPGLQYDDTINRWHTCLASGRINASNPCSEYMFLDDSACNLASLNLLQFGYDHEGFRQACRIAIFAMETLVDMSSYPTPAIAKNSKRFRPLGLGYANLGAYLMAQGMAYDSEGARQRTANITALMTAYAYQTSAEIAGVRGPFDGFKANRAHMLRVLRQHRDAAPVDQHEIRQAWEKALALGEANGYRNAQVTVLAPTGTISFMMDCETTSGEPALALTTYKKLVGGGTMQLPLTAVSVGLNALGYKDPEGSEILKYIAANGTVKGAPYLKQSHYEVFQTAIGDDPISIEGHLRMMAAQQPFLSGAISKTVNLPETATLKDVDNVYWRAWQLGLKSIALYRNNCKLSQPANAKPANAKPANAKPANAKPAEVKTLAWGERKRLTDTRNSITHKFTVGGQEGYLFVGLNAEGMPAELFMEISKEGSTLSGLLNMTCIATSIALQHGAPLATIVDKFKGMKFQPEGFTGNKNIRIVSSIADYIGRWLEKAFIEAETPPEKEEQPKVQDYSGPSCSACGNLTVRNGSCHVCPTCGTTTGCS